MCQQFAQRGTVQNGVIVHSELLLNYLQQHYPELYLVSSTTKVLTDPQAFQAEVRRAGVPVCRAGLPAEQGLRCPGYALPARKGQGRISLQRVLLFGCTERRRCYEAVSRKNLGEVCEHRCTAPGAQEGYRFSKAMENPGFIGTRTSLGALSAVGLFQFQAGRAPGLGSALVLEFLLYYLTRPEYQIHVREAIYLDNMLDLF